MKNLTLAMPLLVLAALMILVSSCSKDEENNNPTISSVTVNPANVEAGGMVTVTVAATDPDGDALTYTYTVSGGAIAPNGSTAMWTAPSQAGAYSVSVNVSDGNGGTASSNGALTVVQPPTQIQGIASFPAGTSGDLSNSKVSIYTSYENWEANSPIEFTSAFGAGSSVEFTLVDINPGNYYLDVWKDNDNDGEWSTDDYVGWWGSGGLGSPDLTEIQIAEGETVTVSISMFIIEESVNSVSGTATLQEGQQGDLAGAIAGLYLTINDFLNGAPTAFTPVDGNGPSVTYGFTGIDPGAYYVGIWKDTDGNQQVSVGDFLGWFGSGTLINPIPEQVEINEEDQLVIDMTVFLIENVQNPTAITGTATMAAGGSGDLAGSKAYLYTSLDNWNNYNPEYTVNTTGSGQSIDFIFQGINPGTYLMDVWKDTDGSGDWTGGDFVGVYGDIFNGIMYEIIIEEGETLDFDITMYELEDGESSIDRSSIRNVKDY